MIASKLSVGLESLEGLNNVFIPGRTYATKFMENTTNHIIYNSQIVATKPDGQILSPKFNQASYGVWSMPHNKDLRSTERIVLQAHAKGPFDEFELESR